MAKQKVTSVQITSPPSGATLSGLVTFTASAEGAASVDYWIAGHSVVTGHIPEATPYSSTLDTRTLWDGPVQFTAVARDRGGNITAISPPVNVTIGNFGQTEVRLLSPDVSRTLSGQVSFEVHASGSRPIAAFVYSVDGKETAHECVCGTAHTDTFRLDTTALFNGPHYLAAAIVPDKPKSGRSYGVANAITQFTVRNSRAPVELRANLRSVYFQAGRREPARLTAWMLSNDGSVQPASEASFASDDSAVASVSSAGVVAPGTRQGIANITITAGGKSTTVLATNMTSHTGFPHFTKTGRIVYDYDVKLSLWVRTLFSTNAKLFDVYAQVPAIGAAGFASALRLAGVNAINSNFYSNPADDGITDLESWKRQIGPRLESWLKTAKGNGFSVVGTGDDVQRSPSEMKNTLTSPWAADSIRYTLGKLMAAGNVISLEMQDEVGGAVTPAFRQIMGILNSVPRPAITWPVAGSQKSEVFAAWMGDPSLSDYASLYWAYTLDFRPGFSWGHSLWETKNALDQSILRKLAGLQVDKPKFMETLAIGPLYFKHTPGDRFQFGQDQMFNPPTQPEAVTAEILYAAAAGFAGVRVYGYDGAALPLVDDELWGYRRAHEAVDPGNHIEQQTGASPFSNLPDVQDRWQALSNAFNLIQMLEPYMLSPQIDAPDLGSCMATGARQLSSGAGRILIAVNLCDKVESSTIDLGSYRYASAGSTTRYHVAGLFSSRETVRNDASQTVSMAPGEAMVWLFTSVGDLQPR